ncbi:hypothetical protein L1D14_07455 [Vibrio tubiashii]|uniref:hypothetical protein n=1 Tax=Vibrio tubiashii TaxID=29498 RepID=UPI001EFEE662|nr:hypothetical protein [Vibrio tubiashii]MCG9576074.1 hypothetical protein [Vibrio tubiashii]
MNNDLKKYVKPFLLTADYSAFGHGDEQKLEPAILTYCFENEILDITASKQTIREFSELVISELHLNKFTNFVNELELLVDEFNLDYHSSVAQPNYSRFEIDFSFGLEDEFQVDRLIRHVRNKLTNNYDHSNGKYPLAVKKSHVLSANCWSVQFYLSSNWSLKEDIQ